MGLSKFNDVAPRKIETARAVKTGGVRYPNMDLVVMVTNFHPDRVEGVLMSDGLGKKAGEPVVVSLRETKYDNRRSILEMYDQQALDDRDDQSKLVHVGGMILFEQCWLDHRTGNITAHWGRPLQHEPSPEDGSFGPEICLAGYYAKVDPVRVGSDGKPFQTMTSMVPESGVLVETFDHFMGYFEQMVGAEGFGLNGFVLRSFDNTTKDFDAPNAQTSFTVIPRRKLNDEGDYVKETPDEVAERLSQSEFWMENTLGGLKNSLANDDGRVWVMEPAVQVNIGRKNVPHPKKGGNDFSDAYKVKTRNGDREYSLYAQSNIQLKFARGSYVVTYAAPTVNARFNRNEIAFFPARRIPSEFMSAEMRAHVIAQATRGGWDNSRNAEAAGYDEPDYAAEASYDPRQAPSPGM